MSVGAGPDVRFVFSLKDSVVLTECSARLYGTVSP